MNPVPKPTKLPKQRKRLKRRYNPDPFPDEIRKQIYEEQEGICAHPGCCSEIEEYHHRKKKGMGGSKAPWRHDRRNGVGLCTWHHTPLLHSGGQAEIYWTKYWEEDGIKRFGWFAGKEI